MFGTRLCAGEDFEQERYTKAIDDYQSAQINTQVGCHTSTSTSTSTFICSPSCTMYHAKNATAACFSLFLAQYSRSW